MSLADVIAAFTLPGALSFDEPSPGLIRATVTIPACTAELYLHGGHLTRWEPSGTSPVLFLSPRALYAHDKAIRGGIPVIFPWFGARTANISGGRTGGSQHGFARTSKWALSSTALAGDSVRISLTLPPNDASRSAAFDDFTATLDFLIGATLNVRLTVANTGTEPVVYEEALHTYFEVSDVANVTLEGLAGAEFLDKTDDFKRKRQEEPTLTITGPTDRPYLNTEAAVTIVDPVSSRKITVAKTGSSTTVVWNPWSDLGDVDSGGWRRFVCVESANVAENRVAVLPGASHALETTITVFPIT